MTKKKNIQASNQNVKSSENGTFNSTNSMEAGGGVHTNQQNDFQQKANAAMMPGIRDTKGKR